MLDTKQIALSFAYGIIAVTLIDVLGSITSRKLKYNYVYLSPLSFLVYTAIGYYASQIATLTWALLVGCLVGVYDGTVGWKLSIVPGANFGIYREQNLASNAAQRISVMISRKK